MTDTSDIICIWTIYINSD